MTINKGHVWTAEQIERRVATRRATDGFGSFDYERHCEWCRSAFSTKRRTQRYCSRSCWAKRQADSRCYPDLVTRVMQKILVGDGCWDWQASLNDSGYGQIAVDGRPLRSHRVVYEMVMGPIPDGLTLDHLCRNRRCCRPSHLEPVTRGENVRRGVQSRRMEDRTA